MDAAKDFENHIAEYEQGTLLGSPIERIRWRNPASSNYYMSFLAIEKNLIVTGDAYDAIYEVGYRHSMKFWASTDACYLSGKLRGLNGHPDEAEIWDSHKATEALTQQKAELRKEVLEEYKEIFLDKVDPDTDENTDEGFAAFCVTKDKELETEDPEDYEYAICQWMHWNEEKPEDYVGSIHEWGVFLSSHGRDVFGDCDMPYGIGQKRNPQIDFHLEGLKLAIKQLEAKGIELLKDER